MAETRRETGGEAACPVMDEALREKVRGLAGLCVRSRQAVFGEEGCLKQIRGGACGLLLLDSGASRNTREKYEGACARGKVPLAVLPRGLLGEATGRSGVAMALLPGGLCQRLRSLLAVSPSGDAAEPSNNPLIPTE